MCERRPSGRHSFWFPARQYPEPWQSRYFKLWNQTRTEVIQFGGYSEDIGAQLASSGMYLLVSNKPQQSCDDNQGLQWQQRSIPRGSSLRKSPSDVVRVVRFTFPQKFYIRACDYAQPGFWS
jgi:hypothetical protein